MPTPQNPSTAANLEELPEFDLECLYNDRLRPSELTVFSSDEEKFATAWMTVDRSLAVSLDQLQ